MKLKCDMAIVAVQNWFHFLGTNIGIPLFGCNSAAGCIQTSIEDPRNSPRGQGPRKHVSSASYAPSLVHINRYNDNKCHSTYVETFYFYFY